jgi:phospholipid/cholesterol/gamma-HCH transport system substrate-binding protein
MLKLTAEAKVGLLVLAGSVVLLWMTFAVGKFEFGEKKGYVVITVFDSVAGLDEKAAVRMAGVKIGTVEKVELADSRARLVLRIAPGVRIKRGAHAMIKTLGLLGEKYVEIVPAPPAERSYHDRSDAGAIQDGEEISVTVSPSDVDKLIGQLSAISDDIKQVTASLRQVFGSERGTRSMEDILADLRATTGNIREFSSSLRSDGSELVMRLNELAANLNDVVGENRDNLRTTMENVRQASRSAELALASIENITQRVERGEGTLGKLVTDDSMYSNIDTAARGFSNAIGRLERTRAIVGFRSEYYFPDLKNYFTLAFMPRPDKAYIFEVTNDPYGKYTRSESISTPPGTVIVNESFEDKFKFSIMIAKRWGNLAARAGLIESEGGVAADYYLFDDRMRVSFDAWNFNSKELGNEKVHLKAGAEYRLGDLFFINAGYDNFLNQDRVHAFAGIGIRFDDDDLKYLLTSLPRP